MSDFEAHAGFSPVRMGAILSVLKPLSATSCATTERRRRLLANVCRMIGEDLIGPRRSEAIGEHLIPKANGHDAIKTRLSVNDDLARQFAPLQGIADRVPAVQADRAPGRLDAAADDELSPRLQQTLQFLLAGDSEKQVARRLGLSPHTVHVYVKKLYRRYDVSSRGELLAKWVSK